MIAQELLTEVMYAAMRRAAVEMPPDVRAALEHALAEETDPMARRHLEISLRNADLAARGEGLVCADTGFPLFFVKAGNRVNIEGGFETIYRAAEKAVERATAECFLRPTMVDPLHRGNPGNNVGPGMPKIDLSFGGDADTLLVTLRHDSFTVEPPNPLRRCTPESVAAHSLYEQPDPECFYEPEGKIDMSDCSFEQTGERAVTVRGSRLVPAAEATLKLEGAVFRGYRAVSIAGIRDPNAIASLDALEQGVLRAVAANLAGILAPPQYTLRFLEYGRGASEAAVVIEAVAPTQELADTVVSLARSSALHQAFPNRKATAGNLAFPFSPSDFRGGEVYEFALYHLVKSRDLNREFHPETIEIGASDEAL